MAMASPFLFLMLLLGGGGVGMDLLDSVPTDAYLRVAGIEQNVGAISEALQSAPDGTPRRAAAHRQMLLRALGELGDKAALPTVEKFLADADPLTADYARAAAAELKGDAYVRPGVDREALRTDLASLPSKLAVLGQMGGGGGLAQGIDPKEAINEFTALMMGAVGPGFEDQPSPEEMADQMVEQIVPVLAEVGNVRVHALTLGVAENVGNDTGFVVFYLRGQYDRESMVAMVNKGGEMTEKEVGGITFFGAPFESFYFAFPSDELAIIVGGPSSEEMPLEEIAGKIRGGGGDFALSKDLAKLLGRTDMDSPAWALAKVTETFREAPFLAPFDTLALRTQRGGTDGKAKIEIEAKGSKPEEAAAAIEMIQQGLAEGKKELADAAEEFPPAAQMKALLDTITVEGDGAGNARLSGEAEPGSLLGTMPMAFFGISARSMEIPDPDLQLEAVPEDLEAVPAVPEEDPALPE